MLLATHHRYAGYFYAEHNLGLVYLQQHRDAMAERQFLKALQLLEEPRVYTNLALAYVRQGRFREARAALLRRYPQQEELAGKLLARLIRAQLNREGGVGVYFP